MFSKQCHAADMLAASRNVLGEIPDNAKLAFSFVTTSSCQRYLK